MSDNIEPEGSSEPVVKEGYLITLEWDKRSGSAPFATCTCGEFTTKPSTNMARLGVQAFKHAADTGHQLRQHVAEEPGISEAVEELASE